MEDHAENCVGRNHVAPPEYKYLCIYYNSSGPTEMMSLLRLYAHDKYVGNIALPTGYPFIRTGKRNIFGKDVFVINQFKQGYYWFWWKCREDAIEIHKMLEDRYKKDFTIVRNPIYKYNAMCARWECHDSFEKKEMDDLIGYDHYIVKILKDIDVYSENIEFLKSIGEGYRSLNYLLYGLPGTGKTTLIKAIASFKKYSVHVVSGRDMKGNVSTVLNPKIAGDAGQFKIVLFEDFDRYLKNESDTSLIDMSQILNQLDGIETGHNNIRFFTANDPDVVLSNKALTSRLSGKFKFDIPTRESFAKKFDRLLTCKKTEDIDLEKKEKFVSLVVARDDVTLRPFTNYVIRYLFDEDYLDKLIENIDEL